MGRHHNIFQKDENGRTILKICPLQQNINSCFVCEHMVQQYNFSVWKKDVVFTKWDFIYYQRFTYEIKSLGDEHILDCINETLSQTYLKTSDPNRMFYNSNHFGIFGFFHPHPNEFLSSCLSFEIYSLTPFPEDNIREINRRIRDYFFLCECDFTYGTFPIKDEMMLLERQKMFSERSVFLLKSENYTPELTDTLFSIVSAGLTKMTIENGRVDNPILNNRVQVNSHQPTAIFF